MTTAQQSVPLQLSSINIALQLTIGIKGRRVPLQERVIAIVRPFRHCCMKPVDFWTCRIGIGRHETGVLWGQGGQQMDALSTMITASTV